MKEELPSIFVTDGWETDQNAKLVEVAVPSSVKTLQAPKKITFYGKTINWIPSNAANLQEFEASNCTTIPTNGFQGYSNLNSVYIGEVASLFFGTPQSYSTASGGAFYNCTNLTSVSLPSLTAISNYCYYANVGTFFNCINLRSVHLPSLTTIVDNLYGGDSSGTSPRGNCGAFFGCTGLSAITLPVLVSITTISSIGRTGAFFGCTGLQSVQLGSEGHAVTAIGNNTFGNCTQSGLTITVYTSGGASLANEPWGATNAAIVYETA